MSRICLLTGKRANFGQSRSHSNRATKKRQNVNLQTIRVNGQRVRVAARTLRTLKKLSAQLAHGHTHKEKKTAAK
jgi:large subunit ribosomal protein L28